MNKQAIVAILIALTLGLGGGYWFAGRQAPTVDNEKGPVAAKERKPLFYRNPMNPAITSPTPAKDPMGMDYIPVYANNEGGGDEPSGTVTIDPVTVQNIGVRTALAERHNLSHLIRAVGRVTYDEQHLVRLHPKDSGWIEKLFVDETGQAVKADQILLSIYSPQLVTSQQEFLLAKENARVLANSPYAEIRQGAEALVKSSRERLELLDVPEHQIRELETSGEILKSLHIHSPAKGIVMKVGVRVGQYVTPKTELYMLADLSKIWVYVDVYEYELPWVKVGDKASMELVAVPGRTYTGTVSYIYPYLESKTRTNRVRIEFDNSDLSLKPEMFATVTLQADSDDSVLAVPSEAVIRSGSRDQVFVVRSPGKFEPRVVKLGLSSNGLVQILSGVKQGERVVVSAQFLIDSESKLREATAKMMEVLSKKEGAENKAQDDMSDMDMGDMSIDEPDKSTTNTDGQEAGQP